MLEYIWNWISISKDSSIANIINGNNGFDTIYAGEGNDAVRGGADSDLIYGGLGNDNLFGDTGFDVIFGGAGNDKLTGGGDADVFVFCAGDGSDTILDFEAGVDKVDLTNFGYFEEFTPFFFGTDGNDFVVNFLTGDMLTIKDGAETVTLDDFFMGWFLPEIIS